MLSMIEKIINKLKNQKIIILGFGREGQSSYRFIRKYLPSQPLTIADQNDLDYQNNPLLKDDQNLTIITGTAYLDNLNDYDLILKTPGISLNHLDISAISSKITSQLELFLENARQKVIGVTGTKGKSTTSSLIYEILKTQYDVVLAGNIGKPIFDLDLNNDHQLYVLEMSSHQLEYLHYSPHVGIVLNLFEDHLDHALTVSHYHEIKLHMFSYQTEDDYMIYCSSNETLNNLINQHSFLGQRYPVNRLGTDPDAKMSLIKDKIYYNNEFVFTKDLKRHLLGIYNLENIMVAFLVGKIFNIPNDKILHTIAEFQPLPYRMEYVGTVNDIKFYVDTLATIPVATEASIEAIKDVDTLIFGGLDRGISYQDFITYLQKSSINHFICMPKTAYDIGAKLDSSKVHYVKTLAEAVSLAKKITAPHTSCLLSPAAASYEYFKNYQEKGDKFKELVLKEDKNN